MNKQNDLIRAKNMLTSDRINFAENFYELLEVDLSKTLKEYFDFNETPKIHIEKVNGTLQVNVCINAVCVKIFNTIPNSNNF